MQLNNVFDIPQVIVAEPQALDFIRKRLAIETFSHVKSLRLSAAKENFKHVLDDYYSGKCDLDGAVQRVELEVVTPPEFKRISRWAERLARSEVSKLFTLGYGDYLMSIGDTQCFVPHTNLDESPECLRLIVGRTFSISEIQSNIYANYGLKEPVSPTVPLHANCRHIIARVSKL